MKLSQVAIHDKSWCVDQYLTQLKSVKQIRRETGLGVNTIKRALRGFNIPIRQVDNEIVHSQQSHPKALNGCWKGKRNNCGYRYIYNPEHPNAPPSGYINEHRFIVEQSLGRLLGIDEWIHHVDMDKGCNDLENLSLCSKVEHRKAHASFQKLCKELMQRGIVYFDKERRVYGLRD